MPTAGPHPYFDDQRTAAWYLSLEDGLAAAQAAGRRVFVHIGHRGCSGSRALIERVIPKEEIGELLRERFVCVGLGTDDPAPALAALLARLPRREPTPVCAHLLADGKPVHSTVGGRPPAVFLRDLTEALAKK